MSTAEITKALVKFHSKITPVPKLATNPFFKSKYATLDGMIAHCKEELVTQGLTITQTGGVSQVDGSVCIITALLHESGESISGIMEMKPVKSTPQDYGSTLTYCRRYGYSSILGLATDDDDDGNEGSKAPVKKKIIPKKTSEEITEDHNKVVANVTEVLTTDSREAQVLIDRIDKFENIHEAKNWKPKHRDEVNALMEDDKKKVVDAYTKKLAELDKESK